MLLTTTEYARSLEALQSLLYKAPPEAKCASPHTSGTTTSSASWALHWCARHCPGCWASAVTLRELPISTGLTLTVPTQCGRWCSRNMEGRSQLSLGPGEGSRSSPRLKLAQREEVRQKAGEQVKTLAPPPSPLHSALSPQLPGGDLSQSRRGCRENQTGQEQTSEHPGQHTEALTMGQLLRMPQTCLPALGSYIISCTQYLLSIPEVSSKIISPWSVAFAFIVQSAGKHRISYKDVNSEIIWLFVIFQCLLEMRGGQHAFLIMFHQKEYRDLLNISDTAQYIMPKFQKKDSK